MTVLPFPERFCRFGEMSARELQRARKSAAQAIGRRFATRFKLCGEPKALAPVRFPPKERVFPEDLKDLLSLA